LVKEKEKTYTKEYCQRPSVKERRAQYAKEYMPQYLANPDNAEKVKECLKAYRSRPEIKEKQSAYILKYRTKPGYLEKSRVYTKTQQQRGNYQKYHEEYRKRDYVRIRRRERNRRVRVTHRLARVEMFMGIQNGKCLYCSCDLTNVPYPDIHLDHVIPIAGGGPNSIDNIVVSCPACNHKKRDKHPLEFIKEIGLTIEPESFPRGHILHQLSFTEVPLCKP